MRASWKWMGITLYWITRPVLLLILRFQPNRTRVIMTVGRRILLVQNWLGDGSWGLPGGGIKRGESTLDAAIREVKEETGLDVSGNTLKELQGYTSKQKGVHLHLLPFRLELSKPGIPKAKFPEIFSVQWFGFDELETLKMEKDAAFAISRYISVGGNDWYTEFTSRN
jgi:8-oxo-dGTP pyrophosphatase MutT (NUDIX family)